MKPDRSLPPACWAWKVPQVLAEDSRLQLARITPRLDEANAIGGSGATWQFVRFHEGRCAVCGRHPEQLVIDHDHWSGLVRGLLCYGCNSSEGKAHTTSQPAFAGYRRRHPAAILGYYEPYRTTGTCVAFITTHVQLLAVWRRSIIRISELARQIAGERPPPDSALRWRKAADKIGRLSSHIAAAEPLDPRTWDLIETLHNLMIVVVDFVPCAATNALMGELSSLIRRRGAARLPNR